jgi:hypothetical protein
LCKCDCGETSEVRAASLLNKSTQSCGCSKVENAKKRILDLTGQKFGRLLVTGPTDKRVTGRICWECLCDCGKTKAVISNNLVRGIATSCGCYNLELIRGNKFASTLESGVKYLLEIYRSNAQTKDRSFCLSFEEFKNLTSSPCHYCGSMPSKVAKSRKARIPYTYNGIDRKNNDVGYEIDNCLPCCSFCNHAKHILSYEDFLSWIQRLVQFNLHRGN